MQSKQVMQIHLNISFDCISMTPNFVTSTLPRWNKQISSRIRH